MGEELQWAGEDSLQQEGVGSLGKQGNLVQGSQVQGRQCTLAGLPCAAGVTFGRRTPAVPCGALPWT